MRRLFQKLQGHVNFDSPYGNVSTYAKFRKLLALFLLKLLMFYVTILIGCNNEHSKQLQQKFGNTYEYINNAVEINASWFIRTSVESLCRSENALDRDFVREKHPDRETDRSNTDGALHRPIQDK